MTEIETCLSVTVSIAQTQTVTITIRKGKKLTGEWEYTRNDKEWECNTRSVSKICVKLELKDNTKHVYKYVCTPEYTNTDGHKSGSAFKRKHETNAKNANFKSHRTATKFLYS